MRIFLTGATGFIGSYLTPELINAGHQVLGLTRSDAGAESLLAAGAEPHRGTLEDLASLSAGAAQADAVIHCAFDHDFTNFVANCEKDTRAIKALGEALKGSNRPLLITSGVGLGSKGPGQLATEDHIDLAHPNPRTASELAGAEMADAGINVSVMRLPQVHDTVKQGLITYLVALAREKGVSPYIGEGQNSWSAGHVVDVAHLYRLAIERAESGARYNAVAEEGVSMRDIAEVVGRGLDVPVVSITPEEATAHFGWMAMFANMDLRASNKITREKTVWNPTGPTMLTDLANMDYSV